MREERTRHGADGRVFAACLAFCGAVLALALASAAAPRPGPTISAQLHPEEVALGQEARLSVTILGLQSAPAPRIPAIDGLDVRSIGQTMSMQIVGGQISSDVTHNFVVRPSRVGRFTIPALSISADEETLETNPLTLRVVAAGQVPRAAAPPPSGRSRGAAREPQPAQPAAETPPLRLSISGLPDRSLWVGELFPIQIRLDVRADVQVTEVTSPKLAGRVFSLTQPSEQQQPEPKAVTIGGARYARFHLPAALSPVTAGDHDLELSMTATVLVPRQQARRRSMFDDPFFDSFFGSAGGGRERREVPIATQSRRIRVNALPDAGRPADFSGGIGRFRVSAKASPTEVAVGDPLTLEVTVTGEGNFDRLALPPLDSGTEWKTYPQTSKAKSRDQLGHAGTKTFEQVIIPERVDAQAVPARELAYFDPDRGRYERALTEPIALTLRAAPRAPAGLGTASTGTSARASSEETGAFEIAPNQIELGSLRQTLSPLARSPRFLALQLLPLALVAAGFAWARRRERLAGDAGHQRAVAASRAVRAELKRAEQAASRSEATAFFAAARRALQERVATSEQSAASLTLDDVESRMAPDSPARETVRAIFAMADAVAYSGARPEAGELAAWRRRLVEAIRALPAGGGRR
jgi:hypothetical protein